MAYILPMEELLHILDSKNARRYVVGGTADFKKKELNLLMGDMTHLTVPFSAFESNPCATPDFTKFSLTDYGQTIVLGDQYEAATDYLIQDYGVANGK